MSAARTACRLLACLALATGAASAQDDALLATLDALLAQPDDPVEIAIAIVADGKPLATIEGEGGARCLLDVGDVTGDGAPDFAAAFAPGAPGPTLQVRDGRTGALLWSAHPGAGGFRSLGGLAVAGGRLAAGPSSRSGRVEVRETVGGALLWGRDLASAGAGFANVLAVRWAHDADGDGQDDLLVAGGHRLDGVWLLSGADGATLWHAPAGDAVYAAIPLGEDLDGDGTHDVLAVGGDALPVARALSGADGSVLWAVPLPGTGTVLLALGDVDGDGMGDVAAGLLAAPGPCLVGLSGRDGALLWSSESVTFGVTALASVHDLDGDGHDDLAVGSFENALYTVVSSSGLAWMRSEVYPNNTGGVLGVASPGDADGNGSEDVLAVCQDHRAYLIDADRGFITMVHDLRGRAVAAAILGDGDGDGRNELLVGSDRTLRVLAGTSGIGGGPVLSGPFGPSVEPWMNIFGYPTSATLLMAAVGPGSLTLPGYSGALQLELRSFAVLFAGTMPGAGSITMLTPPFPPWAVGLTAHFQSVSIFEPGLGAFSNLVTKELTSP